MRAFLAVMVARLFAVLLATMPAGVAVGADLSAVFPQVRSIFPDADAYGGFELNPPSAAVYQDGRIIGYVFLTEDVLRIPAYSGKPIDTLIGLDPGGRIAGLAIVHHDEPILAAGIQPARLVQHVSQYVGLSAFDAVTIGAPRAGHVALDGIAGATITVMVENATVMRSARMIAESRGMPRPVTSGSHAGSVPTASPATPEANPRSAGAKVAAVTDSGPSVPTAATSGSVVQGASRSGPAESSGPSTGPARGDAARPVADASVPGHGGSRATGVRPFSRPSRGTLPTLEDRPSAHGATLPASPQLGRPQESMPEWMSIWTHRKLEIAGLAAGLALLMFILVFQDWLARHPTALTYVRNGFHVYTLVFLGWWSMAQLSVVNVLTFVNSVMHGFRWESFLIDPLLFILWSFVAVTLLLWGRGVYCGWLCPFGALQELVLLVARRLKLPQWEFPDVVHERLWAVKYVLLIVVFGLSLQSLTDAAPVVEVEPFKTVFALRFDREPQYVLYALVLIAVAFVNRKFYCKYLCTLGAAVAVPGRFRLFEWWLRRRKECGKPCQVCAHRCSVRAIRPTGEINANECHYCLDCQVIYYNDAVCLPLIDKRKRSERRHGAVGT